MPCGRRFRHPSILAAIGVLLALLAVPGPVSGATPAGGGVELSRGVLRGIDSSIGLDCRRRLMAGHAAALCQSTRRSGITLSVRGGVRRWLVPGRKLTVKAAHAGRRAQLVLVYRLYGGRTEYVRFSGFAGKGRLRATVSSRRKGSRLTVRLRTGRRTVKPTRQVVLRPTPSGGPDDPVAVATPAPAATVAPPPTVDAGWKGAIFEGGDSVCGPQPDGGDQRFNTLWATCGAGWTGGDVTISTQLPDGRVAWVFGDTFVGRLESDGRRAEARVINNSLVVQDGGRLLTRTGGSPAAPASLFTPADSGSWYWPGDATVDDGKLKVVLTRFSQEGEGMWGFARRGSAVATLSLPDMNVESIRTLPGGAHIGWGSTIMESDVYTYVYGSESADGVKYAHVARARRGALSEPWEYWDGTDWNANADSSARLVAGVSNQFSVIEDNGSYVLVTQEDGFGRAIHAMTGPTPVGPWSEPTTIATVPEPGAGRFTYNAVLHPEFGSDGGLLLSYNTNAFDPQAIRADGSIYRPRFLRVTLPGH